MRVPRFSSCMMLDTFRDVYFSFLKSVSIAAFSSARLQAQYSCANIDMTADLLSQACLMIFNSLLFC